MTVATTTNKAFFNGSGSTGPFTFTFKFWDNSEIYVAKTVAGVSTVLTETTHYTLIGAGTETGGSVTLVTALAVGEQLTIIRTLALVQQTDIPNNGPFYAQTIEDSLDKLEMQIQQVSEASSRALQISPYSNSTGGLVLPNTGTENTLIGFDANGDIELKKVPMHSFQILAGVAGSASVTHVDATLVDATATLPASGEVVIIKSDDSINKVIIQGAGASTVLYGSPCALSVQGESIRLLYDADSDNWNAV